MILCNYSASKTKASGPHICMSQLGFLQYDNGHIVLNELGQVPMWMLAWKQSQKTEHKNRTY